MRDAFHHAVTFEAGAFTHTLSTWSPHVTPILGVVCQSL